MSVLFIQNGSNVYFSMFFIERSFSVEFQILEHINFIDDLPELVLYIGSAKEVFSRAKNPPYYL